MTIDIVPPPTSFFVFTNARSGSMPVVSQSMARPIVPVGAMTTAWLLRTPLHASRVERRVPRLAARRDEFGRHAVGLGDLAAGGAMHVEHAERVFGVRLVAVERTEPRRGPGARAVRRARHQRRDLRRPRPTLVGVVRQSERHQHGPEVGVPHPELAECTRGVADLLGRVVGTPDEDLLRGEDDVDGVGERSDVERPVLVQVLEQVDRGQIAG